MQILPGELCPETYIFPPEMRFLQRDSSLPPELD